MAIAVPTRLWLGGVVAQRRDRQLVQALAQPVRGCALCRPLLITFDGFRAYVKVFQQVFRSALPTGAKGRPRGVAWPDVALGQVVKRYGQRRVTEVERHLIQGSREWLGRLLESTQGGGLINTAYIERLNAAFRASFTALVRRSRAAARALPTLTAGMYLVGCVYNRSACRYHDSLALELALPRGRRWLRRTPAIAAILSIVEG